MHVLKWLSPVKNALKNILLGLVWLYRKVGSPIFRQFGGQCRFHPSCSTYAVEALKEHGAVTGAWLTTKRFVKCGPFHEGGYDPVPKKKEKEKL